MYSTWAPLQAVLNTGPHYILEDQKIWAEPIDEFGMSCRISAPLRAEFDIFPQEDGLLIRGRLIGQITLPCGRCAEDAVYDIQNEFDSFEPFPEKNESGELDPDVDEYFIRFSSMANGANRATGATGGTDLEVNLAALAWEEFAQALPVHPLCGQNCAGLCPNCGANLNEAPCGCSKEESDPRMAKLRGLKINR